MMNENEIGKSTPALAIATILVQPWTAPWELSKGLKQGTIFPDLCLPFYAGGDENGN